MRLVRFGSDAESILKMYTDWHGFTQRNMHTFLLTPKQIPSYSTTHACFIPRSYCASVSSSPSFFPLCFIFLSEQLSLPLPLPLSEKPSKGLVSFHNSWSCSYGSGNHVRCESVHLKGSLRLHHLIQNSDCSSCCAQVQNMTKSTRPVTPGS